tara:strand:- start:4264 stop:5760 length:1497 start_codon:yes stop_codon:yes gene_type:complete
VKIVDSYLSLEKIFSRIKLLEESIAVLHWDWAVKMPEGGATRRAQQISEIEVLVHELLCDSNTSEFLDEAGNCDLLDWQRSNLKLMGRRISYAKVLPGSLVRELSELTATCEISWRKAREEERFKIFAESFKPVVDKVREKASILSSAKKCDPYDALMDQFDPGGNQKDIDLLFDELKSFLPDLLSAVRERQKKKSYDSIKLQLDEGSQYKLAVKIMEDMGFDFSHGRLDTSHHPFCGGVSDDVRITTRFNKDDLMQGLMAVVHETGHAIYERNLPLSWKNQPIGDACGMAVHESQSLLFEMQFCRSMKFFEYLEKHLCGIFGAEEIKRSGGSVALYNASTEVKPGLIRVDADEVTYPFHIFLRYDIEKKLMAGSLEVDDLPSAWNEHMYHWLDIVPKNPRDGVMQDIHWATGSFGYFPSYTMGAILAAQICESIKRDIPTFNECLASIDFEPIIDWLKEHVHSHGSNYERSKLIEMATGAPIQVDAFRRHLESRYLT